jgi:hypothetical protein
VVVSGTPIEMAQRDLACSPPGTTTIYLLAPPRLSAALREMHASAAQAVFKDDRAEVNLQGAVAESGKQILVTASRECEPCSD